MRLSGTRPFTLRPDSNFMMIGERTNVTGSRKFAKLIKEIEGVRGSPKQICCITYTNTAVQEIEHGSFYRVLETFKGNGAELVEEVNQVRRYRNWVAHGRRTAKPHAVDPETAFNRLKAFLETLKPASKPIS